MSENKNDFHVGLVGAGIGGLTAAIAIARAGARVTVLEAAEELGEVCLFLQLPCLDEKFSFSHFFLEWLSLAYFIIGILA